MLIDTPAILSFTLFFAMKVKTLKNKKFVAELEEQAAQSSKSLDQMVTAYIKKTIFDCNITHIAQEEMTPEGPAVIICNTWKLVRSKESGLVQIWLKNWKRGVFELQEYAFEQSHPSTRRHDSSDNYTVVFKTKNYAKLKALKAILALHKVYFLKRHSVIELVHEALCYLHHTIKGERIDRHRSSHLLIYFSKKMSKIPFSGIKALVKILYSTDVFNRDSLRLLRRIDIGDHSLSSFADYLYVEQCKDMLLKHEKENAIILPFLRKMPRQKWICDDALSKANCAKYVCPPEYYKWIKSLKHITVVDVCIDYSSPSGSIVLQVLKKAIPIGGFSKLKANTQKSIVRLIIWIWRNLREISATECKNIENLVRSLYEDFSSKRPSINKRDMSRVMQELVDFYTGARRWDRYPTNTRGMSLKRWLELSDLWHQLFVARINNWGSVVVDKTQPLFTHNNPNYNSVEIDGYTFSVIDNAGRLREEGRTMQHCVFAYLDRCVQGDYIVYSVSNNLGELSTLGIMVVRSESETIFKIQQHYGPRNSQIEQERASASVKLVKMLNGNAAI